MILIETILQNNSAPTGAAIYAGHFHNHDGSQTYLLRLHDLLVIENHCSSCVPEQDVGAAIYYSEVSNVIVSGGKYEGNSPQGAIQGFSGNLYIDGDVLFRNNTGESGGAIHLMNNANLYFNENCSVVFDGSTASTYGDAIYILGDANIPKNRMWMLCAIHFIGQKQNYSIAFSDNKAFVAGQSIYASPIYLCSLTFAAEMQYKNSSFYFKHASAYCKRIFSFSPISSPLQILSLPLRILLCSCNDTAQGEIISSDVCNIATTPGRTVLITATTVDSDSNMSPAVIYTNVPANSQTVAMLALHLSRMCNGLENHVTQ